MRPQAIRIDSNQEKSSSLLVIGPCHPMQRIRDQEIAVSFAYWHTTRQVSWRPDLQTGTVLSETTVHFPVFSVCFTILVRWCENQQQQSDFLSSNFEYCRLSHLLAVFLSGKIAWPFSNKWVEPFSGIIIRKQNVA